MLLLALALVWLVPQRAGAHPPSQGSLDVVIHRDWISIRARVTVEEVTITNRATTPDALPGPFAAMDSAAFEQHAAYLASHLRVTSDGKPLAGGVASVTPPENPQPAATDIAVYELLYALPPKAAPPSQVRIRSDILADGGFAPGSKWEATYIVRLSIEGGSPIEGLLLTSSQPLTLTCDWPHRATFAGTVASASPTPLKRIFKDYFLHGIHHIFSKTDPGYDHLLFVCALVLGTTKLWELFKLVTAFTLAHTITLTLAAFNLVHISPRVVEPLIALSIVCVAMENLIWPAHSHGGLRLAAAFFFGLFHGLGFAGALLQAMQGMSGTIVLPAILAFSLGVETAHQMVVIPLFFLLKIARHTSPRPADRQRISQFAQRAGSAAISLAGLFYLFIALRPSFAS